MEEETKILLTDLILPIIKDLITPKIKSVFKTSSSKGISQIDIEKNLDEYLTQRYLKFQIINTLVFPNKQTLLDILYEPLTLSCNNYKNAYYEIKIDSYPGEFLPHFIRAIIEDTAGMGKSTITKKLFTSIIKDKKGFPILIELSQLSHLNNILTEIQKQLSGQGNLIPKEFIVNLFSQGDFVFLFDGYDEISLKNKEIVVVDLKKFIETNSNCIFLITSRPDESLTAFGDFQKFKVKPLKSKEAYSLIERHDFYSHHKIAKSLLLKLSDNYNETLDEYLNNPFLVSLLYKSYDFKKDIPIKKTQFYQQVFDALFENHDLSKEGYLKREKYSNLHIDDFERVLRFLAYFTSIENKVEYDKNDIIKFIGRTKSYLMDLNFKSSDFLKDLITTVPIFRKEGVYYKWSHKSLQDYFSAKFIWIDSQENQKLILRKIFEDSNNNRFYNLLELYYELDPKYFETTIVYWLLKEFEEFVHSRYRHLNKKEELTKRRLENSFGREITIIVNESTNYKRSDLSSDREDCRIRHKSDIKYFIISPKADKIIEIFIKLDFKKETILKLIAERIPNLVLEKEISFNFTKDTDLEDIYLLNDDVNNPLNINSNFAKIYPLTAKGRILNYDNAFEKLKEIEKILDSNINDDLLNW